VPAHGGRCGMGRGTVVFPANERQLGAAVIDIWSIATELKFIRHDFRDRVVNRHRRTTAAPTICLLRKLASNERGRYRISRTARVVTLKHHAAASSANIFAQQDTLDRPPLLWRAMLQACRDIFSFGFSAVYGSCVLSPRQRTIDAIFIARRIRGIRANCDASSMIRGILGLNLYNIAPRDLEVDASCWREDRHRIIFFRLPSILLWELMRRCRRASDRGKRKRSFRFDQKSVHGLPAHIQPPLFCRA